MKQILFSIVFIISLNQSFATECGFTVQKNGPLKDRLITVTFTNGKTIKLIGHNHGSSVRNAQLIPLAGDTTKSNSDYLKDIKDNLQKSATAVRHANEELQYLEDVMVHDKPDFIGLEATETGGDIMQGMAPFLDGISHKAFDERKIHDPDLRQNMTLLLAGASNYLKLKKPSLFSQTPIMGMESGILEEHGECMAKAYDAYETLLAKAKTPELKKDIEELSIDITTNYVILDQIPDDKIIAAVLSKVPSEIKEDVRTYLIAELASTRMLIERDKYMTNKLWQQVQTNKSGILFIGQWHLQSLTTHLLSTCRTGKPPVAKEMGWVQSGIQ